MRNGGEISGLEQTVRDRKKMTNMNRKCDSRLGGFGFKPPPFWRSQNTNRTTKWEMRANKINGSRESSKGQRDTRAKRREKRGVAPRCPRPQGSSMTELAPMIPNCTVSFATKQWLGVIFEIGKQIHSLGGLLQVIPVHELWPGGAMCNFPTSKLG